MPELPEVETTRRGVVASLKGHTLDSTVVRDGRLRWPVEIPPLLLGKKLNGISRRGKYLLFGFVCGDLIIHLGMSGTLRIVTPSTLIRPHDHVDLNFSDDLTLRFNDARRFGSILWQPKQTQHRLLHNLGVEPLSDDFSTDYLRTFARKTRRPIKSLLMDSKIVVGIGNIYANEALFRAGIRPTRRSHRVSKQETVRIVADCKSILQEAIEVGGTTLKDFIGVDGQQGYFKIKLKVYGRSGLGCVQCQTVLKKIILGQRQTVYCPRCQR
ncbi:MAG: bifunctional DNA-formamidopyrimidine glycosylase/DNA-(apurinic or apyrimidinic site) lyase [Gammaproteobacteria bacterium]|nr:bifunctional DNA-formamidopyrimidine glycosylase/DNA-(apurinic or apyrimidinic site) lyase [Gammaproteobacteria bacterium]